MTSCLLPGGPLIMLDNLDRFSGQDIQVFYFYSGFVILKIGRPTVRRYGVLGYLRFYDRARLSRYS